MFGFPNFQVTPPPPLRRRNEAAWKLEFHMRCRGSFRWTTSLLVFRPVTLEEKHIRNSPKNNPWSSIHQELLVNRPPQKLATTTSCSDQYFGKSWCGRRFGESFLSADLEPCTSCCQYQWFFTWPWDLDPDGPTNRVHIQCSTRIVKESTERSRRSSLNENWGLGQLQWTDLARQ